MADNWKTDGNCSECRKQNYCGNPCKAALIRRQEEIQHLIKQGISKVMNADKGYKK